MPTEEWKIIKDYENYMISNLGRAKSIKTNTILNQRLSNNGYLRFNVRNGNSKYEKPKTMMTHKLVAENFLLKIDGKNYVNHKDGNKQNNNIANLEWCTAQENTIHSFKLGLQKPRRGKENKRAIKIYQYNKNTKELLNIFYGATEAQRNTNINHRDIRNNCIGKQKTCKGFIFSYKEVM